MYDARTKYGVKSRMQTWPSEKLKKGDLVLMEVQISRYNAAKDKEKKGKNIRPQDMTDWRATFDLIAVSLLEIGPAIPDVEEVVPDFADEDFGL